MIGGVEFDADEVTAEFLRQRRAGLQKEREVGSGINAILSGGALPRT